MNIPSTVHRQSIDILPAAVDLPRRTCYSRKVKARRPDKLRTPLVGSWVIGNSLDIGLPAIALATAGPLTFVVKRAPQNRTKPAETPPSPQNRHLIINDLRNLSGRGRPVLS